MKQENVPWKGKTGGGSFGQKSLLFMFRFLPVRIGYFFVALSIPFYVLFDRKSTAIARDYFQKQIGLSKTNAFWNVFRNYYCFGQIIIDRFAVLAKRKNIFQIDIEGDDLFKTFLSKKEGFVIVSSHVGNFELLGYLYPQDQKTIYSMIYGGEAAVIQEAREKQFGNNNIRTISVNESMDHIFTINNALSDGEIVSIPADRIFGSQKSVNCRFLNGSAQFPIGPFMLSAINNVSALAVFVIKTSSKKYKLYLKPITADHSSGNNSKAKAEGLATKFAEELETIVRQYPEQWFNFYQFWNQA